LQILSSSGKEKGVREKDVKALVSPRRECAQLEKEMQTESQYNFLNIQTMSLPQSIMITQKEIERGRFRDTTKQATPDLRE